MAVKREESKRVVNSRDKGARGEREFIDTICKMLGREKTLQDKRNNQATPWGGLSNPDVSIAELEDMHFEVKNCKNFQFGGWTTKLLEDVRPGRVPVIAYKEARKGWWMLMRLQDVERFAVGFAEALGYEVKKK